MVGLNHWWALWRGFAICVLCPQWSDTAFTAFTTLRVWAFVSQQWKHWKALKGGSDREFATAQALHSLCRRLDRALALHTVLQAITGRQRSTPLPLRRLSPTETGTDVQLIVASLPAPVSLSITCFSSSDDMFGESLHSLYSHRQLQRLSAIQCKPNVTDLRWQSFYSIRPMYNNFLLFVAIDNYLH